MSEITETATEQRLRRIIEADRADSDAMRSLSLRKDADAIDAGREAIALWGRYMDAITPVQRTAIYHEARALRARCEAPA